MQYRIFGRGTGLRVSEIALGSALFGTAWGYGSPHEEASKILAAYADAGGNFIDTADFYQAAQAETIIGKFLRGQRHNFVVATKYSLGADASVNVSNTGNSRKNLVRSIEASLQRLATDHIDVLWVHMADAVTSTAEIMRALDDAVAAGKILYVGFSDFPAWRIARAATFAELRGWAPVIGMQCEYSLVERSADRELLPMARALGLGVVAWSPLGGGLLTGKYRRGETGRATTFGAVVHSESDARKTAVMEVLLKMANDVNSTPSQVALGWLLRRGVIPIIGPRTAQQLEDNLGAARLVLTESQLCTLDNASAVPLGFPHDFLADPAQAVRLAGGNPERIELPHTPVD